MNVGNLLNVVSDHGIPKTCDLIVGVQDKDGHLEPKGTVSHFALKENEDKIVLVVPSQNPE